MSAGVHMYTEILRGGREGQVILTYRLGLRHRPSQRAPSNRSPQRHTHWPKTGLWSHTASLSPPSRQRSLVVQVPAAFIPSREPPD